MPRTFVSNNSYLELSREHSLPGRHPVNCKATFTLHTGCRLHVCL